MNHLRILLGFGTLSALGLCPANLLAQDTNSAVLRDGDRVVLVGGAFVERLQNYGYLETLLTAAHPQTSVRFRNLGWSGDNVFGLARAVFGKQPDGFRRLEKDLKTAAPTTVWVCYGANEAHAGEAGLPQFQEGLEHLLDQLRRTGVRVVLLAPPRYEALPPPLPNPSDYNTKLQRYCEVLQKTARSRGLAYVDWNSPPGRNLTDNGVHWNEAGYWRMALWMAKQLPVSPPSWRVEIDAESQQARSEGTRISDLQRKDQILAFTALDKVLPPAPLAAEAVVESPPTAQAGVLQIRGLASGSYRLENDGQVLRQATAKQWAAGVSLAQRGGSRQAAELRRTIQKKNELFFHRHRPQNETYLFLFRKHEQGNNAVEIPQFDPLIDQQEKRIAQLRKPQPQQYRLVPAN